MKMYNLSIKTKIQMPKYMLRKMVLVYALVQVLLKLAEI